jgi:hypothetical protein
VTNRRFAATLLLSVAAIVFSAIQIRYSLDRGRLATTPIFDDVSYCCDGMDRLDALYSHGVRGFIRQYRAHAPHSPFSSVAAMLGYAVFGFKDWAPYLINSVLVFALLLSCSRLIGGVGLWHQVALCLLVLTLPLSADMVLDFRPNFAWGLATSMAVLMPLRRSLCGATLFYRLSAGTWLAVALLCKTSAFPMTLITVGFAWFLAAICDRMLWGKQATFQAFLTVWILMLAPVVLFALPHYLIAARGIITYIYDILYGRDKEVTSGSVGFHFRYYLTGEAGEYVLGNHFYLLIALICAGAIMLTKMAAKSHAMRDPLCRAIALGMVTAVAFIIPTINPVKANVFGIEFQLLLVLGSVLSLRTMIHGNVGARGKQIGSALLLMATVAGIMLFKFPAAWGGSSDDATLTTRRIVHEVQSLVMNRTPAHGTVFVTSAGQVSAFGVKYLARQQGRFLTTNSLERSDDISAYSSAIDQADCVVAAEPGVPEFYNFLAGTRILRQTLNLVSHRADFELSGRVVSETGARMFIFNRWSPFCGFDFAENLNPQEGPYAQWNLPIVRWGTGQQTRLHFSAVAAGTYRLSLVAQVWMDGQSLTYLVDGNPIAGRKDEFVNGKLKTVELSFPISAGPHEIVLKYATTPPPPPMEFAGHSLLYRQLRLTEE